MWDIFSINNKLLNIICSNKIYKWDYPVYEVNVRMKEKHKFSVGLKQMQKK